MAEYDDIHVISDLHLGGSPGFQIFDQGPELAALVRMLATVQPRRHLALVLNGDVVDFLAENAADYFDAWGAADKLERIAADPAFADVFAALGEFVARPRRELVVVLGNHDVELALPSVRNVFARLLARGDAAARGRITFATDGAGWSGSVDGRRVVCLHGNEADPWNVVDYEALRKAALALNGGLAPAAWSPNAGTRMVIEVMNGIKREQPFVDLLKPERRAVSKVLLALESQMLDKLTRLAPVLAQAVRDHALATVGLLGAGEDPGEVQAQTVDWLLRSDKSSSDPQRAVDESEFFLAVERRHLQRQRGGPPLPAGVENETLGTAGLILDRLRGKDPSENLREALRGWFGWNDRSFELDGPDPGFADLCKRVAPDVPFLTAGHTHLMRCLPRDGGVYYNSGSWVRLMKLSAAQLDSAQAFQPVYQALKARSMQALESCPGLVLRQPTVVSFEKIGRGAAGQLGLFSCKPQPRIVPIEATRREY